MTTFPSGKFLVGLVVSWLEDLDSQSNSISIHKFILWSAGHKLCEVTLPSIVSSAIKCGCKWQIGWKHAGHTPDISNTIFDMIQCIRNEGADITHKSKVTCELVCFGVEIRQEVLIQLNLFLTQPTVLAASQLCQVHWAVSTVPGCGV